MIIIKFVHFAAPLPIFILNERVLRSCFHYSHATNAAVCPVRKNFLEKKNRKTSVAQIVKNNFIVAVNTILMLKSFACIEPVFPIVAIIYISVSST